MTLRKSGMVVETMSFGSSRGGIPSFVSATSKAYRFKRLDQFLVLLKGTNTILPEKFLQVYVKTWMQMTHQLVILINIFPGERAEISGVKREE